MKKIMLLIFLIIQNTCVAEEPLTFVTEPFPPFNYEENEKIIGPSTEIVEAVCAEMEIECTISMMPWRRALILAKDGNVNGIFSIAKRPEREEWAYFSLPLVSTGYGFFVQEDNQLNYNTPTDLEGYTIGVYSPSSTSKTLEGIASLIEDTTIVLEVKNETALKKLSVGRYGDKGAVFINKDVGNYLIKILGIKGLRYSGNQSEILYHVGFSKVSNPGNFVLTFNDHLIKLYNEGKLKEILKKYDMEPVDISKKASE